MPRLFTVASWNVEHFRSAAAGAAQRVQRVVEFISGQHGGPSRVPEVFALYEVEGRDVYQAFMTQFPDHRFHLTEGKQSQEIFVGVHRRFQTFTTQRLEFKAGREYQRPGLFLTLSNGTYEFPMLFLHVRSGSSAEDFGLRDAALTQAFNLRRALDRAVGGPANFIFMGDLNTMGIDDPAPYSRVLDLAPEDEVARMAAWATRRDMLLQPKDQTTIDGVDREVSWWNHSPNYDPSNLDHVVAADHLDIRKQGGQQDGVSVIGWPQLPPAEWRGWIDDFSDHGMLVFEVWV